jgi:hypothetical protein
MDLEAILQQLREERDQVDESILAMERLQIGLGRRRGRPPKWLAEVKAAAETKKRGRPPGSGKKPAEAKGE